MNMIDGYLIAFLAGMVTMAILILMFQPAEYRL